MSYLLDTNTCIYFLNERSEPLVRRIKSTHPQDIVVCSIVKAELYYGALKSSRPMENLRKQQEFLQQLGSIPFDDHAAHEYGHIRSRLEKRGIPIGPNDMLIAAIAIANGAILITHNIREFERIEGMALEDWRI